LALMTELNSLPLLIPRPPAQSAVTATPTQKPKDRRAIERVPVELECEERIGKSRYFRLTSDLSPFGLCTRSGLAHPVGTQMDLHLYLPDDRRQPLHLTAEVVAALPDGGIRLAFKSPARTAVRRIHRFLRAQARGTSSGSHKRR